MKKSTVKQKMAAAALILASLTTFAVLHGRLGGETSHVQEMEDLVELKSLQPQPHHERRVKVAATPRDVTYSVKGTPTIYAKSDGWDVGSSRKEGEEFCGKRGEEEKPGSRLCPYEAYCLGGKSKRPFAGIGKHVLDLDEPAQGEIWAPLDGGGQPVWVGLGAKNICHQRGQVDGGEFPTKEAVAPFIMCCHMETETMQDRTLDWFEPSGNAESDREYDLLVLVLAGGGGVMSNERFNWQQDVWLEVSRATKRLGLSVKIYLMTMDPDIQEATTDGTIMRIPGTNNYIPGCMEMTIKSIEYIHEAKLPGHRHRYLLRTNISSLWCFPKYLSYINERFPPGRSTGVYDGILGDNSPNGARRWVGGAGILLSQDLERLMVNDQKNLKWDMMDDTAIGVLLLDRHNETATLGKRQDFTSLQPLGGIKSSYWDVREDQFHFRVKSRSHGEMADTVLQDKLVMSYLFFHCYGDGKIAALT
ncbi:hypothetical protein ACHAXR_004657 [Thalassiosira sp. AJA248-18]